jgi:tetratricopeptide (TPR) repeat protein
MTTSKTALRKVIEEAKLSRQDLAGLLHRAKFRAQADSENVTLRREEIQKYLKELFRTVVRILDLAKLEEETRRNGDIRNFFLQMEDVRIRLEQSFGRLEAFFEQTSQEHSRFDESLFSGMGADNQENRSGPPRLNEVICKGKTYLDNEDYDACIKMMNQALLFDPENSEALAFLKEAQRKHEEEELAICVENLKKEAMDHFDGERYEECLGLFKSLCELEPQNRTLHDYLDLSRQMLREVEEVPLKNVEDRDRQADLEPAEMEQEPFDQRPRITSGTGQESPSKSPWQEAAFIQLMSSRKKGYVKVKKQGNS